MAKKDTKDPKAKAEKKEKPEKKDKKKKGKEASEPAESDVQDEVLVATTELEPEPEEVQFTDTSYTSASFESLPPLPPEDLKPKDKRRKKKRLDEKESATKKTSSEMFTWSEESLPPAKSELEQVIPEEDTGKKKKGKKGKKGKGDQEEIPDFPKPKAWKKMNKKEREAWLLQRIEDWRAEKEAAKQAILAGANEKRLALARARNNAMAMEIDEHEIRKDLLKKTVTLFNKYEMQKVERQAKQRAQEDWAQYLRCDGLPDPRVVTQMNTYLHLWTQMEDCDDNELDKKCKEVLPMLEMLEQMIIDTKHYSTRQLNNYNEVRLELRTQLAKAIQMASYHLLRNLEKHLNFESTKLATYQREFKALKLNIWVAIKWPTRRPKPVEPDREPVELSFPSMNVIVKLPAIIDASCVCVRAARSMIDLLSEKSRSFAVPPYLDNNYLDLFEFNQQELDNVIKTKQEQDDIRAKFYKEINQRIRELEHFLKTNPYTKNEKEKEELDNLNMSEPPIMPEPREYVADLNFRAFRKYCKLCRTRTRAGEINLRKYRICGGVLNLDLITTPPQPKRMKNGIILTTLQLPKTLQPMKYQVQYRAPSPPPPGVIRTPEEIEAENKKVEAQYEKLAQVFIDLPREVIWTEPPVVCQWQAQRSLWTSNYVNDYKFNEDKLTVQFRTGVLWPIGIATLKYSNLPFQGWDVKPDPHSKGVLITVTGIGVTCTWLCLSSKVRLKFIANATTPALQEHFNKPYTVPKMMQLMREAGCDFFPEFDAHNHIEGSCYKEWSMELHNYHAMAFLSRAYNFQWSRWNAEAGNRIIIMQFREAVDTKREAKLSLLYLTPQRATILKCNEMTTEMNHDPINGLPFLPDLFTLNMHYGSVDARRTTFGMKYRLTETVYEMLQGLKLSSFS